MRRGRFYRFGFDFPFGFYFRREPFGFYFHGPWGFPRREEYLRWLEEYKRDLEKYREELEEELKEVEKEIEELRKRE